MKIVGIGNIENWILYLLFVSFEILRKLFNFFGINFYFKNKRIRVNDVFYIF